MSSENDADWGDEDSPEKYQLEDENKPIEIETGREKSY